MRGRVENSACSTLLAFAAVACSGSDASSGAGSVGGASGAEGGASEYEVMFNGQNLDGFELVGLDENSLRVENGVLVCTGQPSGYFYAPGIYSNFSWRVDFRFVRPSDLLPQDDATWGGNSGYFVYIQPPHQVWPRALEVQGQNSNLGDVFSLPDLAPLADDLDQAAALSARWPVGEWNTIEVLSVDGALTVWLNSVKINYSPPTELREGQLALESEGVEVHFRNIEVKRLP